MTIKDFSMYVMTALYIGAGLNHFWHPEFYKGIIPKYFPWHSELNVVSGLLEIILGIMLLFSATRSMAAWGIIVLLIAFLPVHIQMIIDYWNQKAWMLLLSIFRLPLQGILIYWAYGFTK
jgi:uncharacterized membrane protein